MMKKVKWIVFCLILLLLLVVVFRNLEETNLELIVTSVTLPLAALLTITLSIGFFMGFFASALWKVRNWRVKVKTDRASDTPSPAPSSN